MPNKSAPTMPDNTIVRFPRKKAIARNNITKKFVDGVSAIGKPQIFRDSKLTGFALRVSATGRKSYIVESRIRGEKSLSAKRITIGDVNKVTIKEARTQAIALLSEMQRGKDPVEQAKIRANKNIKLRELLALYLDTKDLKERTIRDYKADIENNFTAYLNRPIRLITADFIREWYIAGYTKKATTDRAYRTLKTLLQFAVGMQVLDTNPAQSITDMGIRYKANKRTKFISFEELGKLLKAITELSEEEGINTTIRDWLILVISTGLREKESKGLLWENVSFDEKFFTIKDTKNKKDLTLPMTSTLYLMLKQRNEEREHDVYVFPNRFGTNALAEHRKTLSKIIDKADIEHASTHDFRRTFATICDHLNVNANLISIILNHSKKDITQQYIQVQQPKVFEVLRKVEDFLDQQIPFDDDNNIYATGVLKHFLYNHPKEPDVQQLGVNELQNEIEERAEREYWGV